MERSAVATLPAEEIAVIRHGDRRHLLLDRDLHQLVDIAGSVEHRMVGVAVQVTKDIDGVRSRGGVLPF
jgi:hypothetical protein